MTCKQLEVKNLIMSNVIWNGYIFLMFKRIKYAFIYFFSIPAKRKYGKTNKKT